MGRKRSHFAFCSGASFMQTRPAAFVDLACIFFCCMAGFVLFVIIRAFKWLIHFNHGHIIR